MAPPLILSPEGLRADGRRAGELRRLKATLGSVAGADGSCAISHGNTALEAAVYGPQEVHYTCIVVYIKYLNIDP
jgi:exosome complex component RRP41